MLIDGTPVKGRQMIAVIGIDREGMKHVLGLREGATENATVVRELLEDLARRGVDFTRARLYVLDGAKALHTAVKKVAGASALIQRGGKASSSLKRWRAQPCGCALSSS
jgi:transposase-like protein